MFLAKLDYVLSYLNQEIQIYKLILKNPKREGKHELGNALTYYSYNILEDKSFLLTGIVLDFNVATLLS